MKSCLLHPDRAFAAQTHLPPDADALVQDLGLGPLLAGMAQGDEFLAEVGKQVLLSATTSDVDTIRYRQAVLADCLAHPVAVRQLYTLALEAIESERKIHFGLLSKTPDTVLRRALEVLNALLATLARLQQFAAAQAPNFTSGGFTALLAAIGGELGADYLAGVRSQLHELEFADGVLVSATLGVGNKGAHYTLRKPPARRPGLAGRLFGPKAPVYTITIPEEDRSGARALWELRERGINPAADALGQAADHMLDFFNLLRAELAFYIGCLNLHAQLAHKGEPACFPTPHPANERRHTAHNLYDVGLSLLLPTHIVGNDLDGDHKGLFIITGANQGGKSTFLRSIGQAQLMMQAGMFVGAESFAANICTGLFTHYRREEDAGMISGKLDEELARMSAIVDRLAPDALLLCNESFAATNEREGSEIARQIVTALAHRRIKLFFVTHLNEFAHDLYAQNLAQNLTNAHFLRAGRSEDGKRTFKLCAAAPLHTSFGEDLYQQVFG